MKSQKNKVGKEKRARIRHYKREVVIVNPGVEDARIKRESVMHDQVDKPGSTVKDSER